MCLLNGYDDVYAGSVWRNESRYSKYTLSDVSYITGTNGELFASIGRWPIRSMAELRLIVDNSIQWSNADHRSGDALQITEHTVADEQIDFAAALGAVGKALPSSYTKTKVYVDKIKAAHPQLSLPQALAEAKAQIINELNTGPDLVLYNGHASTRQFSSQNLFKSTDIAKVTAAGSQLWMPLSCYVTYYESTHMNTLAHQLLFSGNAVNITDVMLLSNQNENLQMGESILSGMMTQGLSLGEAVKRAISTQSDPALNINWSILGDPSASF